MHHLRLVSFLATNVGLTAETFERDRPDLLPKIQHKPELRPKITTQEETENHYMTLGIGWDATPEVIRKNYKQLALYYHPDKRRDDDPVATAKFSKISSAYAILSDPLRRLVYDLVLGIRDKTDSEIVKMSKMKMEQALEDVTNMACTVPLKREEEEKKKGLVIVNATYGIIYDETMELTTLEEIDDDICIDVTVPMQCMVENSTLILPSGESKAWLTGFYDPCIGESKQLRVRYLFWGRLHEVVINDEDPLKIPMKGHLLGDEVQFKQLSPTNRRRSIGGRRSSLNPRRGSLNFAKHLEEMQHRNRKMLWWFTALAGGVFAAVVIRKGYLQRFREWIEQKKLRAK